MIINSVKVDEVYNEYKCYEYPSINKSGTYQTIDNHKGYFVKFE